MNRSSKGALAAAAAATLLLGGAGSLAYWSDAADIAGGTINTGELRLTDTTAGGCASSGWTLDDDESPQGVAFDPAVDTLVPGDVLTRTCTYTIAAAGEHLRATVSASGGATSGALASAITADGTFTVGGGTVTEITSADDGDALVATITLTFDPTADNTTQLQSVDLSDYVVTLEQIHG